MADQKVKSPNGSPKPCGGKTFSTPKSQAGITNAKSHKNGKVNTSGMGGSGNGGKA